MASRWYKRPQKNWPSLLKAASSHVTNKHAKSANHLLNTITNNYARIAPIKLSAETQSPYNFDQLYERLCGERPLAEFFDALIQAIIKIIDSGEVESVTTGASSAT